MIFYPFHFYFLDLHDKDTRQYKFERRDNTASNKCYPRYETRFKEQCFPYEETECTTGHEEKCEDVTQGYTTEEKCTKWPVQKCKTNRSNTKKYSPVTDCKKVPREVCGPGTEQVPGAEECFDRVETAIIEVNHFIVSNYPTSCVDIKLAIKNC